MYSVRVSLKSLALCAVLASAASITARAQSSGSMATGDSTKHQMSGMKDSSGKSMMGSKEKMDSTGKTNSKAMMDSTSKMDSTGKMDKAKAKKPMAMDTTMHKPR